MHVVRLFATALAAFALMTGQGALAQDYPTKSISLISPYTAGGPYDILARFLGEAMRRQKLGQTVIVEAKPGGATVIGLQHVLKSPPDGHTLILSTLPITSNLVLMKNPGYKYEDFVAVGPVAKHPYVMFVPASLPVSNLKELVAHAEKSPGKFNIGTLSLGGQIQMLSDRFIDSSKLKIEKIPYKGGAELATALLTGDIQMSFMAYSAGEPFMKDGKLKPIAIATNERSPLTPNIPTFKELGMPDVTGEAWVALFARADTPKPIVAKLNAILAAASKDPEYVAAIATAGNDPWLIAPDKIDDYVKADFKFWEPDLRKIPPQ
jgi:tripartite-type tricarboxylate transporter receptor subunit TctC